MPRFNPPMQRIIVALLLFVWVPLDGAAQDGRWVHTFEGNRTTFLELKGSRLLVWQHMHRSGDCTMYPSRVERHEQYIRHPGGTIWRFEERRDKLVVEMPSVDTTITYRATTTDPRDLCDIRKL